jgi:hypothetical protein
MTRRKMPVALATRMSYSETTSRPAASNVKRNHSCEPPL